MLLDVRGLTSISTSRVLPILEALMKEHGMPRELHSDNGPPFGTTGLARLSTISVHLMKLGIRPVFSRPAKPQDNGGHERMHRDLKAETTRPPGEDLPDQQKKFDLFRSVFNSERPHHALGGNTPLSQWTSSTRPYPTCVESPTYPKHWEVRHVTEGGDLLWASRYIPISKALRHEPVGLEPIDDGLWRIYFCTLPIALLDARNIKAQVLGLNRPGHTHQESK
jgi:hypothetical protein